MIEPPTMKRMTTMIRRRVITPSNGCESPIETSGPPSQTRAESTSAPSMLSATQNQPNIVILQPLLSTAERLRRPSISPGD